MAENPFYWKSYTLTKAPPQIHGNRMNKSSKKTTKLSTSDINFSALPGKCLHDSMILRYLELIFNLAFMMNYERDLFKHVMHGIAEISILR